MYLCTGNLLVKILHFHCRGQGLVPVQGTKIMHATVNGQKKKKKRERERDYTVLASLVAQTAKNSPAIQEI